MARIAEVSALFRTGCFLSAPFRRSAGDQVGDLLKTWRGIVFDHPHLRAYDEDPKTHEVDADYAMLSSSCRSLVNPRQRIYKLKSRLAFL
jgi:hypothetical protein